MKTTVDLPEDLFRKAEAVAEMQGLSLTQWLAALLHRELAPTAPAQAPRHVAAGQAFSRELERLASMVGEHWQGDQDALSATREQRRS